MTWTNRNGIPEQPEDKYNKFPVWQARFYFITLLASVVSVGFSLFKYELTVGFAKISIIATLVSLTILIYNILTTSSAVSTAKK